MDIVFYLSRTSPPKKESKVSPPSLSRPLLLQDVETFEYPVLPYRAMAHSTFR